MNLLKNMTSKKSDIMTEERFTILSSYLGLYKVFDNENYEPLAYWEITDLMNKLVKENEQLKNKIDVLEDDNETYHKSLEKLNLYTKRFIPTKCTNEFKDCKTNRYYWLDHEGNFEGCLELLNLLDCENELLKSENSHLKAKLMDYEDFKKLVYLVLKKEYDLRMNEMNILAEKEDWQGYMATKLERGTVQRIAKRLGVDLE